jgi:hexokinase
MIYFCFTQVEAALCKVQLTGAKILRIKEVFHSEMERGIHQQPSSLQMENTYIPELPDGTGELGNQNLTFRVPCIVRIF